MNLRHCTLYSFIFITFSIFLESSQERMPYWQRTNSPLIQKRLNELVIKSAILDDYSLLELVISEGGDINYQDKNGNTALHRTNLSIKMRNFLLLHGAESSIKNNEGYTRNDLLNPGLHKVNFEVDKMILLTQRITKNIAVIKSSETTTNSTAFNQERLQLIVREESRRQTDSITAGLSPTTPGHLSCTIQ